MSSKLPNYWQQHYIVLFAYCILCIFTSVKGFTFKINEERITVPKQLKILRIQNLTRVTSVLKSYTPERIKEHTQVLPHYSPVEKEKRTEPQTAIFTL